MTASSIFNTYKYMLADKTDSEAASFVASKAMDIYQFLAMKDKEVTEETIIQIIESGLTKANERDLFGRAEALRETLELERIKDFYNGHSMSPDLSATMKVLAVIRALNDSKNKHELASRIFEKVIKTGMYRNLYYFWSQSNYYTERYYVETCKHGQKFDVWYAQRTKWTCPHEDKVPEVKGFKPSMRGMIDLEPMIKSAMHDKGYTRDEAEEYVNEMLKAKKKKVTGIEKSKEKKPITKKVVEMSPESTTFKIYKRWTTDQVKSAAKKAKVPVSDDKKEMIASIVKKVGDDWSKVKELFR